MDRINNLIQKLRENKIKVWLQDGHLRYQASQDALTPELLVEMKGHKEALLNYLQDHQAGPLSETQEIPPRKNAETAPLSPMQQRLWLLNQLEPDSPFYNITRILRLKGNLNIEAIHKAFEALILRHEIFRTIYKNTNEGLIQIILQAWNFELPVYDVEEEAGTEKQDIIDTTLKDEVKRPFDLASDLKLRAKLIRLSSREYILIFVVHHIASDGWSMGLLSKELVSLYKAFSLGQENPLPKPPIQYADFAEWHCQYLKSGVGKKQLEYWKEKLLAPPILDICTDFPRPKIQTFNGRSHKLFIEPQLTQKLKQLCQQRGMTMYMLFLAAIAIVISRHSRQEDIIIGSPLADRRYPSTQSVIGPFLNTLALRLDTSKELTIETFCEQVKQTCLEAYDHRDIPFEQLVEELKPERDASRSPWFQVLFAFQNFPKVSNKLGDLDVERIKLGKGTAKFELTFVASEVNDGIQLSSGYNTDLFRPDTTQRILNQVKTVLAAMVVLKPEQLVSEISLLSSEEQHQLLTEWHQSQETVLSELCIHQLFEDQVIRNPDAVAVEWKGHSLSYLELNSRANQLARHLQTLGIGPDVLVGVCIERSVDMLVSLLAILKAGGAYVPLDPYSPTDRLTFMVADSQISVLITQSGEITFANNPTVKVICLNQDWDTIATEVDDNLLCASTPDHLAYVIYTSGSTGTPKGVMVPHSALVNFTQAATDLYDMTSDDRVLQFASISFDAAAEEIYPTLTSGGTLVLRTDDMLGAAEQFLKKCADLQLTVLDLPTAFWQQIVPDLAVAEATLPDSLRLVIIGGERVSPEHVKTWQTQVGDHPKLINTYGPTEATIVATAFPISTLPIANEVPIGRPLANIETYVLNNYLQPVPIGVPGELHIGGKGLARGYLNRPELTSERFIPHPFSNTPEAQLYKTGDLVRYLTDGALEYLGRIDDQVKIRGFRVELGEVESALTADSHVKDAVVIAQTDDLGSQQLVAYLVTATESFSLSETRQAIKKKLPNYMVPSAFMVLESIPLTPNGKVDRRALPVPDPNQRLNNVELIAPRNSNEFVAPRNRVEETLSKIWRELLKQEKIGIYDDFFELGGHSLLAIQMISRINDYFRLNLLLRNIFEAPKIADLGNRITTMLEIQAASNSLSAQNMEEGEL